MFHKVPKCVEAELAFSQGDHTWPSRPWSSTVLKGGQGMRPSRWPCMVWQADYPSILHLLGFQTSPTILVCWSPFSFSPAFPRLLENAWLFGVEKAVVVLHNLQVFDLMSSKWISKILKVAVACSVRFSLVVVGGTKFPLMLLCLR